MYLIAFFVIYFKFCSFSLISRNIITEIIQTEKAYVNDLFTCVDVIFFWLEILFPPKSLISFLLVLPEIPNGIQTQPPKHSRQFKRQRKYYIQQYRRDL
jgi:hypothetical protein